MFKLLKFAGMALALQVFAAPQAALAQDYPSRPITAVVFGAPGTTPDLFARAVTRQMSASMGQPFVIDNRPGASGVVATREAIRAAPDGYTVLFTSNTSLVNVMHLMKAPPYDPVRELTPISGTIMPVEVLLVRADLPARTVPELVALAKKSPGKLTYGASAAGSIFHLNGELFAATTGTKLVHVAYKSPIASMQDLAAGNVDMSFNSLGGLAGMLQTGRVRVLATLNKQRYKGLPEVPTVAETIPGYEKMDSWFAMMGPAKMPAPIVARLNAEVAKALRSPEVVKWMDDNDALPISGPPEQVTEMMAASSARLKKLVADIGLQPE